MGSTNTSTNVAGNSDWGGGTEVSGIPGYIYIYICLRGRALQLFHVAVLPVLRKERNFRPLLGQAPRSEIQRTLQSFLDEVIPKEEE